MEDEKPKDWKDCSEVEQEAIAKDFINWFPQGLAAAHAEGKSTPFYAKIDIKTGETTTLLFGQAAIEAIIEVDINSEK